MDLAGLIAQAMGALHQIERTGQLVPHASTALENVRTALSQLQAQPTQHPAVMGAMEAVAGSLGLVHALNKMAAAPVAQSPAAYAPTQQQPAQPQTSPYAATQQQPQMPQPQMPQPMAYAPQQTAHMPQPAPHGGFVQSPQPAYGGPPQPQVPFRAPSNPFDALPAAAAPAPAPARAPSQPMFQPSATPAQMVNAELGAHSPTNFYKGLSGNDIIDHGGLFVSTYKIPKIGTPVRLKVHLPGGYEFEANAVVQWARESTDGGNDAPPGFGARFTEITQEARQLVYRYVRNREPLFHDDL